MDMPLPVEFPLLSVASFKEIFKMFVYRRDCYALLCVCVNLCACACMCVCVNGGGGGGGGGK